MLEFVDKTPSPAVGIDLGTTYSCVKVYQNGIVEIVPNDQGNNTTPVCVAFSDSERHFAQVAKNQADINPSNTIFDVKRLIGRSIDDEALLDNMKLLPFKIIGEEIKPKIVVKYKGKERSFAPEEISAMVLCQMAEFAEDYLGTIVRDVVVTVPACFNNIQRQATKDARTIAGLNVVSIINEPTAAAIAYGLDSMTNERKNVLVFDLGRGTFDASLVIIENAIFEVKSVSGNTHLGGRDIDNRMIEHIAATYQTKHKKNIRENSRTIEKLRAACERAKIVLSSETSTTIEIDCFFEGRGVYSTITRAQFEMLNMDLFVECIYHTAKCLKDAKMDRNDINEIVLVGGSSRIPMFQQLLQAFFCGKELCNSINPDEAVAYGAAAQAAVLSGRDHMSFSVVDVTPYSLGLNSNHDAAFISVVIPRNTPIPTRMPKVLSDIPYAQDNPHLLAVQVFEGERPKVRDNISLGVFTLHGIPPTPEGVPRRNIYFEIDADGILTCSFYDLETGYTNELSIEHPSGHWQLSREEVVKMMKDAEIFKRADEWRRQSAKARIALEKYVKTMSDLLKDHGKKISCKDNRKMVVAIEHTREYIVYHWNFLQSKAQKFEEQMKEFKKICDPIVARMLKKDGAKASGA